MLKILNPNTYIEFNCHGVVHLIEKEKIRQILDEPRKELVDVIAHFPQPEKQEGKYCKCSKRLVTYSGYLTREQVDCLPCKFCHLPLKPPEKKRIEPIEYSRANYEITRNSFNEDIPSSVWWEDICRIKDKINEIIEYLNREEGK